MGCKIKTANNELVSIYRLSGWSPKISRILSGEVLSTQRASLFKEIDARKMEKRQWQLQIVIHSLVAEWIPVVENMMNSPMLGWMA